MSTTDPNEPHNDAVQTGTPLYDQTVDEAIRIEVHATQPVPNTLPAVVEKFEQTDVSGPPDNDDFQTGRPL